MMLKLKSMPFAIASVVASGALSMAVATPAMAQEAAAQAPQRVVVTGSMISRADKETPSPVQVLTADDLVKSGKTSVAEVLSSLSANGQGALATGFSGAFANGGAGVSLRGLSVGLTLVLIDGHRMAPYPLSDDAQRQFVDVSSIPFDAVERIEVLKDGASSLYGSDAIAGVVNIILKKSFTGTSVKTDMGTSDRGGGTNYKVAVTHGIGDLVNDGWNAFGSVEYRHANAIKVSDRDNMMFANGNWTSRGGMNLTRGVPNAQNAGLVAASTPFLYNPPATGVARTAANFQFLDANCNYDKYIAGGCAVRDVYSNLQPKSENINLLGGFTKRLNDDWQLALKASMFRRTSENNRGVPATFSPSSFSGFTALVPNQNPQIVNRIPSTRIPASYPGNSFGKDVSIYGYIPGLPASNSQNNESTSSRLAADLTGSYMGWDLGVSAGVSRVQTKTEYSGYVNRVALYNALTRTSNPFKITGGNSAEDLAAIAPTFDNEATSDLAYGDVHGVHDLFDMAGGAAKLGVGLSYIHKKLNAPSPILLQTGVVGSGSAYVFGKETNTAAYLDLAMPVLKNLEIDASARYDHFDTYGKSFTPKVGFKYQPHSMVSMRGTFAKGFRAPNAAENGTAGSFFSFHAINDPVLCADGKPTTAGNVPSACKFSPAYVQLTTPDLQPEKSKSYTFGLILEPMKNLSATIDYYKIKVQNQITSASGLPGFVPNFVRNVPTTVEIANGDGTTSAGVPPVGTIAYASSGYVNAGASQTSGVDLDVSFRQRLGDAGNVRANLSLTHLISYTVTSAGTTYELAGTHGPSSMSGATGNPKNRAQLTLGWDKGPLAVTTTFNWTGRFSALDPSVEVNDCADVADVSGRAYFYGTTTPAGYCHVPGFVTTDLNAQYKLNKNWTLKASILNLFDHQPPIDVATYGNSVNLTAYNATLHQAGAVGRFFSVGANYAF